MRVWEASRKLHGSVVLAWALVAAPVALVLVVPSTASAQAVTGTLLGNVTDSSGAAVPGATVTATEMQTNISRSTVSNEAGYYIFSSLQNGVYSVDAELLGFKKFVRPNVKVDVNTTIRVDLKLEVGQMTESVTVAAESPVLQTDRTDTGRVIESKMVSEIPLTFNRNFQGLLVTVPGASVADSRLCPRLALNTLIIRSSRRRKHRCARACGKRSEGFTRRWSWRWP